MYQAIHVDYLSTDLKGVKGRLNESVTANGFHDYPAHSVQHSVIVHQKQGKQLVAFHVT